METSAYSSIEASCRMNFSLSSKSMSQYKQKCCEPHTCLISFTCYLAQIRRGAVKNSPIAEAMWDHLASVQSRFTLFSVIFSPQLPCWPPTPLPRPSTALAPSCWCETYWITDDLICGLNWKMVFLGKSKIKCFSFFSPPHPQDLKKEPTDKHI